MKSTVVLGFAAVAMSLAAAGELSAAPSISNVSGTLEHGGQLVISGSAFGIKSPAKPYLWAPMDSSGNPSNLGIVTSWSGGANMQFAPGEGIAGGGALKASNASGTWTRDVVSSGFAWNDYGHKMYLFRKLKRNFDITDAMNWKIIRAWPSDFTLPNWHIGTHNGRLYVEGIDSGSWLKNNSIARGRANVWRTEEFWTQANSAANLSDGAFYYMVDGQVAEALSPSSGQWKVRGTGGSQSKDMTMLVVVHGVMANHDVQSTWRMWANDVYLDTTWARVMIGNHPNYQQSTIREIQIPSAWSGNSITITLNTRAFPSDATPYLFVIDAAGNASEGFPIGIAGPVPPGNVTVQ